MRRPSGLTVAALVVIAAALEVSITVAMAVPSRADNLPVPCAPLLAPPLCTGPTAPPLPVVKPPPTPAPATPKPAHPPSPTPTPKPVAVVSGALGVTGVIDDPALAGKVADVVKHPVTAERPSLLHFRAVSAPIRRPAAGAGSPGLSRLATMGIVLVVLVVLGLVGALAHILWISRRTIRRSLTRPRPRLLELLEPRGRRLAVVTTLVPLAVLISGLAMAPRASSPAPRPVTGRTSDASLVESTESGLARLPATLLQTARAVGWARLLAIEEGLEQKHSALAAQESSVNRIAGSLQKEAPTSPRAPQLAAQLQQLVSAHQAAAAAYNLLLQQEYEFFQGAVQSAPLRENLVAVAAATGQPDAASAVRYDLDLVEAQHNQEAALSAAEAQAQAAPATDPISSLLHAAGRPTLISPMGGAVEQGFGCTSLSIEPPVEYNGHFCPHFHTGIDISAPEGTPVHAAAAGRVILAAESLGDGGQLVGYGRYVAIAHGNGFTTVYGHLNSIGVKAGQIVHQGDVIGHEGSTGNSTGPHLHFETRVNGSPVDPAPYLRGILHLR